ncbi:MAG: methionine aminotransferase [Bacteroidota bacterium]
MTFRSKLPHTGTTIFTVMSALAREHQAVNLSQGFPNYDPPEQLRELVSEHLAKGHNQYAPMAGLPALREVLAKKHRTTKLALDPTSELTVTAGATQALFTAITTLVHPGDEVVLLEPAYDCYRPAVELCGGVVQAYTLKAPDYRVDWAAFAELLTERTRLIVLNTPHNPTGTIWRKADWEALAQLLADHPTIYLLSDEVYEQLVYDNQRHYSLLDFPELFQRGFATYSFGKTFHATGWKIGYCIGPAHLMAEFRKVHQFNVFSVNTPAQHALADYLGDSSTYMGLSTFYQQKRDYFLAHLTQTPLRPLPCQGTYFQLVDYSAISSENDVDFARWLTTEVGVAAIPVSAFSDRPPAGERVVRLCFAKTEAVLDAAAARLRKL